MTEQAKPDRKKERPIDRVRRLAEEAGVPFEERKPTGKRTIIFFGSAAKRR